jgi:hypothetical protein
MTTSSLQQILVRETRTALAPILDSLHDPDTLLEVLEVVGATRAGLNLDSFASAARSLDSAATALDTLGAEPLDFAGFARLLQEVQRAWDALRALQVPGATGYANLGRDLLEVVATQYLWCGQRLTYRLLELVGLIETMPVEAHRNPVVDARGVVLRGPFATDRLHPERIGALLRDPVATLRARYFPNGLGTARAVHEAADNLFPRLGGLLGELGFAWHYGVSEAQREHYGDIYPIVSHSLYVYLPDSLRIGSAEAGVVLSLSPVQAGDLGLVMVPFGSWNLSAQTESYDVQFELSGHPSAFSLKKLSANGPDEIKGKLVAKTRSEGDAPAFVVGSATGTRLEIGSAELAASLALGPKRAEYGFGVAASRCELVMQSADGDSFLRAILPSGGLRVPFDLGVGWSNTRGLAFHGSGSLDATLPMKVTLGPLSLQNLHLAARGKARGLELEASVSANLRIGPVVATVERMGVRSHLTFPDGGGGNLGLADLTLGFKAPTGLGLSIDAPIVSGGGFLSYDSELERYSGALHISIEKKIDLAAWGVLQGGRNGQHWSLAIFLAGRIPPVELGWGFRLTAVGGMLALHRRMDTNALSDAALGIRGNLDALLFPDRPETQLATLLTSVERFFPAQKGSHVFGPMVEVTWGRGPQTNARIRAALLVQLDDHKVALYGSAHLGFPRLEDDSIVRVRAGIEASYQPRDELATFSIRLLEAKLFKTLELTGGAAFLVRWGKKKEFAFSVGGFHPRFAPYIPKDFKEPPRLGAHWSPHKYVKLDMEQYFAITSTSMQFGFSADARLGASWGHLTGHMSFDLIVVTEPNLFFEAELAARVKVKLFGIGLFSTSLKGSLEGPSPWVVAGKIKVKILWGSVSKSFRHEWGSRRALVGSPVSAKTVLAAEIANAGNWSSQRTRPLPVVLRAAAGKELAPLDEIEVRQARLPFGTRIEVLDGSPLSDAGVWTLSGDASTSVRKLSDLSDVFPERRFAKKPSKERPFRGNLASGARFGRDDWDIPQGIMVDLAEFEEQVLEAPRLAAAPTLAKARAFTRDGFSLELVK